MISLSTIHTLILDLGNVLLDLDIKGANQRMRDLLSKGREDEALIEAIYKYESGLISTSLFINAVLRLCDYTIQARDVILAWNSMLQSFPAPRLEWLKSVQKNYRLILLSNNNELHKEWLDSYLLREYGIANFDKEYFHSTYYSFQVGKQKPDPQIFQHVINTEQLIPEETLFIDDQPRHALAAQSVGLCAIVKPPNAEVMDLWTNLEAGTFS